MPNFVFTKPRFHPVVGKAYGQLLGGIRLLILGESHYSWEGRPEDETETTAEAMKTIDTYSFWKNTEKLIPVPTDGELRGWDFVAFYNYVQHFVGEKPRDPVGKDMWVSEQTVEGFREVLEVLMPDRVLVLGKTNWRMMAGKDQFPGNEPRVEPAFKLPDSFCAGLDEAVEQNAYWYPTGVSSYALNAPIYHPAHPSGFYGADTKTTVAELLKIDWKEPTVIRP